jgi:hypothetical protein
MALAPTSDCLGSIAIWTLRSVLMERIYTHNILSMYWVEWIRR